MRPRNLLVLALVVGALLALIYFAGDKVASTDERAAAAKRLFDARPDEVVGLAIDWQGGRVRFERDATPAKPAAAEPGAAETPLTPRPWRIVEPFAKLADDAAVARLLATLSGLEATRDLDDAAPADVGLAPPRGTVTWKTAKGEGRLEIGGAVPASHDVVVAASGRRSPAVTADTFVADISRPAGEWRSREVVTATRERIERVTISGAAAPGVGSPVVLARSGETLALESPVADRVDRDLADRLLTDLAALRMETFVDPPYPAEVEKALAAPAGVLELAISGETSPLRIEAGGETAAGKRVWRAGDQVFESASTLAAVVGRTVDEWRSRSWTRFENWRIEKARFEDAVGAFELTRSGGEWLRDGKKIPFTVASDLLAALTAAKADRLVAGSAPAAATAPPRLTVTLSDADGNEEILTLPAGAEAAAAEVPARTAGRGLTLLLPRAVVTALDDKIAAVRAAVPLPEVPAEAAPAAAKS